MRQIVMFNWITADGYFAALDGNLDCVIKQISFAMTETTPKRDQKSKVG